MRDPSRPSASELRSRVAHLTFRKPGYQGPGEQQLDAQGEVVHGDTKEAWLMTNNGVMLTPEAEPDAADPFAGATLHLPPLEGHLAVVTQYTASTMALNAALNELLFDALQLAGVDRERLGNRPFVVLKQMRYAGEPSDVAAGRLGAGAHADWGAFTILATDGTPGLELQMGDSWLAVPPREGAFIINSGDQINQLTNGVYRSAVHRVVTVSTKPRYSTALFTYFNLAALVGPLPCFISPVTPAAFPTDRTTLAYFHHKLRESMDRGGSYAEARA